MAKWYKKKVKFESDKTKCQQCGSRIHMGEKAWMQMDEKSKGWVFRCTAHGDPNREIPEFKVEISPVELAKLTAAPATGVISSSEPHKPHELPESPEPPELPEPPESPEPPEPLEITTTAPDENSLDYFMANAKWQVGKKKTPEAITDDVPF